MTDCAHDDTERGKDIPRRYGSYRSEVCLVCGAFRARDHHGNLVAGWGQSWRPREEYSATTEEMDDD